MKKIHLIGLALFAVLAFGAVTASAAFAEEQWVVLIGGNSILLGEKITVDVVPATAAEGETLLLEDMGAFGKPDILCVPGGKGFGEANGAGEITEATCTGAVDDLSVCTAPITVTALNLPWTTQITGEMEEEGVASSIKSAAAAGPGWEVKCLVGGLEVKDQCTTQNGKVLVLNTPDGLIHVEFMEAVAVTEQANCTLGGKEQGLVAGLFFLHFLNAAMELLTATLSLATPQV